MSKTWPAYAVERWPIANLKVNPKNARLHPKAQIEQIRALMREFGWTIPCLVRPNGTLIAGHGRLMAANLEGYTEAPVIVARNWTDAQCKAYAIADNRVSERSIWDHQALNIELGELSGLGFDLAPVGFEIPELPIDSDCDDEEESELDEVPEKRRFGIAITCRDENHQTELLDKFKEEGLKCRPL